MEKRMLCTIAGITVQQCTTKCPLYKYIILSAKYQWDTVQYNFWTDVQALDFPMQSFFLFFTCRACYALCCTYFPLLCAVHFSLDWCSAVCCLIDSWPLAPHRLTTERSLWMTLENSAAFFLSFSPPCQIKDRIENVLVSASKQHNCKMKNNAR